MLEETERVNDVWVLSNPPHAQMFGKTVNASDSHIATVSSSFIISSDNSCSPDVCESVLPAYEFLLETSSIEELNFVSDALPADVTGSEEDIPLDFKQLNEALSKKTIPGVSMIKTGTGLKFVQLYDNERGISISILVVINENFTADVFVHREKLNAQHPFWETLYERYDSVSKVLALLGRIQEFKICTGNPDADFIKMMSSSVGPDSSRAFYLEGDFCASANGQVYSSTVRSVTCSLLLKNMIFGDRCQECLKARATLRSTRSKRRRSNSNSENLMSSKVPNYLLSREALEKKCSQLKGYSFELKAKLDRMQKQIRKSYDAEAETFDSKGSASVQTLFSECDPHVAEAFPDSQSFQRLFWEEQKKLAKFSKSSSMKWHPMIIRWCLYIKSKSSKAYSALRESGFISLPSERTLFDYSHCIESGCGIKPSVLAMLIDKCEKLGMYTQASTCNVGLLQDEVHVKSDLVYDKHTGDLIGYVNLDGVGNDLHDLQNIVKDKKSVVAKAVLVVMVRGIFTRLKFPLAHYATASITADFLYPIIWDAIEALEVHCGLHVLFVTCDGASANRKFFQVHGIDAEDELTYCTANPFAFDDRKIFFISDAPHLIKTARNCFANSFSHKESRNLKNNGKDISWMHIVMLFNDYCQGELSICPKLTSNHVNLTAFSCMNVRLAAQVLSSTVANALSLKYDDRVAETVKFIRHMNRFFDIMNVRSLYEHKHSRNPDVAPFTDPNDARLQWLENDFLGYFQEWKVYVDNIPGDLSKGQRAKMQLSYQTLAGIEITCRSVVNLTRYLLHHFPGSFVLTSRFNQDVLEQHFGHYRHKGGSNDNPTVKDVNHIVTQLRTVDALALAPKRGNAGRQSDEVNNIDHSPLPRRNKPLRM